MTLLDEDVSPTEERCSSRRWIAFNEGKNWAKKLSQRYLFADNERISKCEELMASTKTEVTSGMPLREF